MSEAQKSRTATVLVPLAFAALAGGLLWWLWSTDYRTAVTGLVVAFLLVLVAAYLEGRAKR